MFKVILIFSAIIFILIRINLFLYRVIKRAKQFEQLFQKKKPSFKTKDGLEIKRNYTDKKRKTDLDKSEYTDFEEL